MGRSGRAGRTGGGRPGRSRRRRAGAHRTGAALTPPEARPAAAAPAALGARYHDARRDPSLAVLEGLHALKHALRFGAEILDARTPDTAALRRLAAELAPDIATRVASVAAEVDAGLFRELAPSPHPTGVIALARRPRISAEVALAASGPAPAVLLDRPTHHGNIGAVVRVAAAAGAAAVLTTGTHDPWHPASLRGGAGLQFALPVARVEEVPEGDRPLVVMDVGGEPLRAGTLPARALLVFGSERAGVSDQVRRRADARVSIPMRAGISSLNLATAVAITLYTAGALFTPSMHAAPPAAER